MSQNCWEVTNCGRQPGGNKTNLLGICPAASESRLNGIHDGKNGGRACWVVAGTLCKGEVQGDFAKKYKNCESCNFYKKVYAEETPNFKLAAVLLQLIK